MSGEDGDAGEERAPAPARPAATVVLLRSARGEVGAVGGQVGIEVLLLRKGARNPFAAGAWVFPGGAVDPADGAAGSWAGTTGELDARAQRLRVPADLVHGWHAAAVREAFEEAGVLLAHPRAGGQLPPESERARVRAELVAGERDAAGFHAWLAERGCLLDVAGLRVLRRWVTPRTEPRRYDTLFVLAAAPPGQRAWADEVEVTAHRWIAPHAALRAFEDGLLPLIHPTVQTLRALAGSASIEEARELGGRGELPPTLPHIVADAGGGPRILEPGDEGYPDELIRLEYPEWAE